MEPNHYAHMSQPDVCYKRNGASFDINKPVDCYCKKDVSQLNDDMKDIKFKLRSLGRKKKDKLKEDYEGQHDEIRRNIESLQKSLKNTKLCLKSAKRNKVKEGYSVKKKASLTKKAIILLSVGGAVLLGGIIALIIVLVKKKSKPKAEKTRPQPKVSVVPSTVKKAPSGSTPIVNIEKPPSLEKKSKAGTAQLENISANTVKPDASTIGKSSVIKPQASTVSDKTLDASNISESDTPSETRPLSKEDIPVKGIGSSASIKPDVPVEAVGSSASIKPDSSVRAVGSSSTLKPDKIN